jgi:hypothetical protein
LGVFLDSESVEDLLAELEQVSSYEQGVTLIQSKLSLIDDTAASQAQNRSIRINDGEKKSLFERWATDMKGAALLNRVFHLPEVEGSIDPSHLIERFRLLISQASPEVVHSALYFLLREIQNHYAFVDSSLNQLSGDAYYLGDTANNDRGFQERRADYERRLLATESLVLIASLFSEVSQDVEQRAQVDFLKGTFDLVERNSADFLTRKINAKTLNDDAKNYFNKVLTVSKDFFLRVNCYGNLANVLSEEDPEGCLQYLLAFKSEIEGKKPASIKERDFLVNLKLTNCVDLENVYKKLKRTQDGFNILQEAVDFSEIQLSMLFASFLVSDFLEKNLKVYRRMIELCLELGEKDPEYNKKALETLEKTSSRVFVEYLSKSCLPGNIQPELAKKKEELLEKLQFLGAALTEADVPELNKTEIEIARIDQSYWEHAITKTWLRNPLAFFEIPEKIPKDTALVEYYTTAERIYVFVVSSEGKFEVVKVDLSGLPHGKLQRLITSSDTLIGIRQDFAGFKEFGKMYGESMLSGKLTTLASLYLLLIEPILEIIKNKGALIIVPNEGLTQVPFQALYRKVEGRNRYLIEDFAISYAPSVSTLNEPSEEPLTLKTCFSAGVAEAKGGPKNSVNEAGMVAKIFNVNPFPATKAALIANGPSADVVHLSCHSSRDSGVSTFNGLVLEDGLLTPRDIDANLQNLNCELFTLSACSTFKDYTSDQTAGLVGSLIHAGAKSVLSSIWETPDEASFMLMEELYRNLNQLGKATALQKAQVKVRNTYSPHPFFWAPFFLVGQ